MENHTTAVFDSLSLGGAKLVRFAIDIPENRVALLLHIPRTSDNGQAIIGIFEVHFLWIHDFQIEVEAVDTLTIENAKCNTTGKPEKANRADALKPNSELTQFVLSLDRGSIRILAEDIAVLHINSGFVAV